MNQKSLNEIENEVKENYPYEKYKGLCEVVYGFEMQQEFLKSGHAEDALGRENAQMEILKIDQAIALRKAEKKFLEEKLLSDK